MTIQPDELSAENAKLVKELAEEKQRYNMLQSQHQFLQLEADILREENKRLTTIGTTLEDMKVSSKKMLDMLAQRELKISNLQKIIDKAGVTSGKEKAGECYTDVDLSRLNQDFKKRFDTVVVLHLYYEDLIEEIFSKTLDQLADQLDLVVTLQPRITLEGLNNIKTRFPNVYFIGCENRGRDIRPFLIALNIINTMGYEFVCKIHTKKSPHRWGGDEWRNQLISHMLNNPENVEALQSAFRSTPNLGLMLPGFAYEPLSKPETFLDNMQWLEHFMTVLNQKQQINKYEFNFPAGSMYWARVAALTPLLDNKIVPMDAFEEEAGQTDGTLAHSIERIVGLIILMGGYQASAISLKMPRSMI